MLRYRLNALFQHAFDYVVTSLANESTLLRLQCRAPARHINNLTSRTSTAPRQLYTINGRNTLKHGRQLSLRYTVLFAPTNTYHDAADIKRNGSNSKSTSSPTYNVSNNQQSSRIPSLSVAMFDRAAKKESAQLLPILINPEFLLKPLPLNGYRRQTELLPRKNPMCQTFHSLTV
jgi:hypothetical protein